ncbi:MAG: DnaJ-domain-containing protein 1 [Pseudohongiellaceae bacterium]
MHKNPLIIPILALLKSQQPMSEHELLTQLERQGDFDGGLSKDKAFSMASDLALFQRHFLIMNALYLLQEQLLQDQLYLQISPLKIGLIPIQQQGLSELGEQQESPALKAYYSDFSNLEGADEQGVDDLLKGFWRRYLVSDKRVEAYGVLALAVDADWSVVKAAYRRLAKQHHPDHGGDHEKFVELRAAYEILQQVLSGR